ncbi:hypothetical protein FRC17_006443 [Serendipita sp. 399]|nr:hypothetical protein FRC17_006443 [Serendipita sp. 399]
MRSVRVLDVLFAANSAINLLSRVATSQASKVCRLQEKPSSSDIAEPSQRESKGTSLKEDEEVVLRNGNSAATTTTEVLSEAPATPLPGISNIEQNYQVNNAPNASKDASLSRRTIRERYAKTPSVLYQTLEPPSLEKQDTTPMTMRASRVPASRIGRLFHYGSDDCKGLAVGMGMGAASEYVRQTVNPSASSGSILMSEANVSRLVDKLSRMRGAALKLGQFMSIQDSHMLPSQVEQIFRRVQNNAHYMPNWQMERVMAAELGSEWKTHFSEFNPIPIAAASIGQVHAAKLASNGMPVAVKVQFPAVAESIASDLNNISMLLTASALLPKGLFLDSTLKATKAELEDECNYTREADCARRFRQELEGDDRFEVMQIIDGLSTEKVLTMERMMGVPIVTAEHWPQELRDESSQAGF